MRGPRRGSRAGVVVLPAYAPQARQFSRSALTCRQDVCAPSKKGCPTFDRTTLLTWRLAETTGFEPVKGF